MPSFLRKNLASLCWHYPPEVGDEAAGREAGVNAVGRAEAGPGDFAGPHRRGAGRTELCQSSLWGSETTSQVGGRKCQHVLPKAIVPCQGVIAKVTKVRPPLH